MDSEKIRLSFEKVRKDMAFLSEEIMAIRREIEEIKANFRHESSIGNDGVPADRQTDRPASSRFPGLIDERFSIAPEIPAHNPADNPADVQQTDTKIQQSSTYSSTSAQLTDLVNSLKTDLKKRFLSLTKQEFLVFSVLFTVEKSQNQATYRDIALKTGLTESSIRDYIQKIIKKGIPIAKEKVNNKVTILKIPLEIRNLATLDNLMRIRNEIPDSSLDSFTS